MKTDGRKVDPQGLTSMWLGLCIGGWFLLIDIGYFHFVQKSFPDNTHNIVLIFITLISMGLMRNLYASDDRYLKVYTKYISCEVEKNKGKEIFFSFMFVLLPYLLLPVLFILF